VRSWRVWDEYGPFGWALVAVAGLGVWITALAVPRPDWAPGISGWALTLLGLVLIFVGAIGALITARPRRRSIRQLKLDCSDTSRALLQFVVDRENSSPTLVTPPRPTQEEWGRYTDALLRHSRETAALYHERFGAKITSCYAELAERGLAEVNPEARNPVNVLGMRYVAQDLGAIAERLPNA
jgi:hypothetical protein